MPLTEEERREIEQEVAKCPHKRGECIGALKIVQRRRGWVSDEALEEVAHMLDMTPDELEGVATAFSLIYRRAVGRHVILICDSVSCWVMGYDLLREHLKAALGIEPGETTSDGRFTLLPVACLGYCDHAPAMMIDEEIYGDLTAQKIDRILEKYP